MYKTTQELHILSNDQLLAHYHNLAINYSPSKKYDVYIDKVEQLILQRMK